MARRMGAWLSVVALFAVFAQPQIALARGRSSPFVKTANGYIPKSVFNAGAITNPQKLQQMREAERKYAEQKGWIPKQSTSTAKKK